MKIKNKLLFIILPLALIPAIIISLIFYIIGDRILKEQIKIAHYEAVSAVDTLIFVVISDMVNIAFTAAPKIAELIEKQDQQALIKELNTIDQINIPNVGTGRGLGYHLVIVTNEKGYILARSNIVGGVKVEVPQKGHILFLDEEKREEWDPPINFDIAFENAKAGRADARKIIYDKEFLRREGYGHLIDKYRFNEMMGLTAFQPIFDQKEGQKEQIGILILITILNNNHIAIGAIDAITGVEFTAITPAGEIMTSFFVNPPIPTPEITKKARVRAEKLAEMAKRDEKIKTKDTITYTIERISLRSCPGIVVFRGEDIGTCYKVDEDGVKEEILFEELKEKTYRFHYITEVDLDHKHVAMRGVAYDLTDYDYLVTTQARFFIIISLFTFLITLLISLIATRKIAYPIIKCTQEIQEIEKKGFGKEINIKTGDEIETLARAFNSMNKKLAQNYEELEDQKRILEIRVEAKTKVLKEFAESLDEQVKEKTKNLQEKLEELEKFHKITIGREIKMIELKKEIEELKEKLQQYGRS
jgi:HAMP domain-containing protein